MRRVSSPGRSGPSATRRGGFLGLIATVFGSRSLFPLRPAPSGIPPANAGRAGQWIGTASSTNSTPSPSG
jgi:hypothetical protein